MTYLDKSLSTAEHVPNPGRVIAPMLHSIPSMDIWEGATTNNVGSAVGCRVFRIHINSLDFISAHLVQLLPFIGSELTLGLSIQVICTPDVLRIGQMTSQYGYQS